MRVGGDGPFAAARTDGISRKLGAAGLIKSGLPVRYSDSSHKLGLGWYQQRQREGFAWVSVSRLRD
jgi:hypothetical protein